MRFRDVTFLIISNLRRMKLRLALTSLGVVIGTSAIVLMVSLGIGLQNNITQSLGDLGDATSITVWGGGMTGEEAQLDQSTLERFASIAHVKTVLPTVPVSLGELQYKRYTVNGMAMGAPMDRFGEFGYELDEGRLPKKDNEIIVGAKIPSSFVKLSRDGVGQAAEEQDLLGKRVVAKGYAYPSEDEMKAGAAEEGTEVEWHLTVVGVLAANQMTDNAIYVPLKAALEMNDQRARDVVYDQVIIKADSVDSVAEIEAAVKAEGFYPVSAHSMQQEIKKTFAIVQGVLGALGAIAMLVAAIGITNTMTMSIYERTREIGIMKAVGASNRQIKRVFLGEAAIIGVLGGLGGLVFSASGAALANLGVQFYIAQSMSVNNTGPQTQTAFFSIPLWLAIFAVAFAAGIGLLSGMLPAVRAANLDPLIALRHE